MFWAGILSSGLVPSANFPEFQFQSFQSLLIFFNFFRIYGIISPVMCSTGNSVTTEALSGLLSDRISISQSGPCLATEFTLGRRARGHCSECSPVRPAGPAISDDSSALSSDLHGS